KRTTKAGKLAGGESVSHGGLENGSHLRVFQQPQRIRPGAEERSGRIGENAGSCAQGGGSGDSLGNQPRRGDAPRRNDHWLSGIILNCSKFSSRFLLSFAAPSVFCSDVLKNLSQLLRVLCQFRYALSLS